MASFVTPLNGESATAESVAQLTEDFSGLRNIPVSVTGINDASAYALTVKNAGAGSRDTIMYAADGTTVLFQVDGSGVLASRAGAAAERVLTTGESGTVTAAMIANRTRNNRIPIFSGTVRAGSPAIGLAGANTRYRAWAFDAAADESILVEWFASEDFVIAQLVFKLWWTNLGAGGGNVVWQLNTHRVVDTGDLNAVGAEIVQADTIAAPAQNILKISTLTLAVTPGAGDVLPIVISRVGSSGSDTLANDAGLVGFEVEYTSDS